MPPGKERAHVVLGIKATNHLWEGKNTSEAYSSSGIFQAELPFELDVSVTSEDTVVETSQGENSPRILVPALEGDRNLIYPHRAIVPSSVHGTPPGGAPQEEMNHGSQ